MLTGLKLFFGKKTRHKKRTKNLSRTIETDCHGKVEALDSAWYNITNYGGIYGDVFHFKPKCIGIVKMKDRFGKIRQYIGLGFGIDEKEDTILVLDAGVPFYYKVE